MESFEGKLAVVTGAGSGIGRELAVQLAAAGCSVASCDLRTTAAKETARLALVGGLGGVGVSDHACDVSDEAAVARLRDEVTASHETDHINLLFNNAGIAGAGSFVSEERQAWERVFDVCWGGVYNCTRAFMPLLVASVDGYLVNTSSVNAFWAMHGPGDPATAYATAKAAVKGFSEALIEDLRLHAPHVKVAVVMPGSIGTSIVRNSARSVGGGTNLERLRDFLVKTGLPLEDASDEYLLQMAEIQDEVYREFAGTSASGAAKVILNGIRAERWRVLVGEDAHDLDAAVRANPEAIYDSDFPGLEDRWYTPMLLLRTQFDGRIDPWLTAAFELRSGPERIAIRVKGGRLEAVRGEASEPSATVDVDPQTMGAVIAGEESLDDAERRGGVALSGSRDQFQRLVTAASRRK